MSNGKFAWEKMGRKRRADEAARDGRAIYMKDEPVGNARKKKPKQPVRNVMPFGKFKGQAVAKVPVWYLKWLVAECDNAPEAVLHEAQRILVELPNKPQDDDRDGPGSEGPIESRLKDSDIPY